MSQDLSQFKLVFMLGQQEDKRFMEKDKVEGE
jgi:hypothetical protein